MKFIRPVDLFDITRALSRYDQFEVDLRLLDQSIYDTYDGIRSAVRKEARKIAAYLIESQDMEFIAFIDSMTEAQELSLGFYEYDKETRAKREELNTLEVTYEKSLQEDSHKKCARELAGVLKEKIETEKQIFSYEFKTFKNYLIFVEQYPKYEPSNFIEKMKEKMGGISAKRAKLLLGIRIGLGDDHDADWHAQKYSALKSTLQQQNDKAEIIRSQVAITNALRIRISQLSDAIDDNKAGLSVALTKKLEVELPQMDVLALIKQCDPLILDSLKVYYLALSQMKFLDQVTKFTHNQRILMDKERGLLKVMESKITNREFSDLTRDTRKLMLMFVIRRPILIVYDGSIRAKLIKEIISTVQQVSLEEAIDGLQLSIVALLNQHKIPYLPSELLVLILQCCLSEEDIAAIQRLETGKIAELGAITGEMSEQFTDDWLKIANVSEETLELFGMGGLGSKFDIADFERQLETESYEQEACEWFRSVFDSSPSVVKKRLNIQ